MANPIRELNRPLNIMHVLRAPLGGLFRHVLDLSREQARRGHRVGLIADSLTGGTNADKILAEIAPHLALGVHRLPIRRNPHPTDIKSLAQVERWCRDARADIMHGHGSKGGAYVRLSRGWADPSSAVRAYTPHGGSLNHRPGTLTHRLYMQAERFMSARTDVLLFESAYIGDRFIKFVGTPPNLYRIVRNGIAQSEFASISPAHGAADFIYVGELRAIKGIDTLLEALAIVGRTLGTSPRAILVGTGPERDALQDHAERLGLREAVSFAGSLPARTAFERGRILVIPSRAESLPYIVLEAAGARIPMIATDVGGIPEIFGPYKGRLLPAGDAEQLARRMIELSTASADTLHAAAQDLAHFVQARFSIETMVDGVIAAYSDALTFKRAGRPSAAAHVAIHSYDQGTET